MKVYYYLATEQVWNVQLPGKTIPYLTAGDVIEVDEEGHQYLQSMLLPNLILSGETFIGTPEEYQEYLRKKAPPPEPVVEFIEEVVNQDAESNAKPPLPRAGSKTGVVLAYLETLKNLNYTHAELDEVLERFKAPVIRSKVEELRAALPPVAVQPPNVEEHGLG